MTMTSYTKSAIIENFGHFFWNTKYNIIPKNIFEKFNFKDHQPKDYIELRKNMFDFLSGKFKKTMLFELSEQLGFNETLSNMEHFFTSEKEFEDKFLSRLVEAVKHNFNGFKNCGLLTEFNEIVLNLNTENISNFFEFKIRSEKEALYNIPDYILALINKKTFPVFCRGVGECPANIFSLFISDNDLVACLGVLLPDGEKKEISIYTSNQRNPESPFNDNLNYTLSKSRFIEMTNEDLVQVNQRKQNLLNILEKYN